MFILYGIHTYSAFLLVYISVCIKEAIVHSVITHNLCLLVSHLIIQANSIATSASFSTPTAFYSNRSRSSSRSSLPISIFSTSFALTPKKPSSHLSNNPYSSSPASQVIPTQTFVSRYDSSPEEPRKGADILVEALERQGVDTVFAYPGEASVKIHHALTLSPTICTVLPRYEQGGIFAAEGYARSSGRCGVCISTSGPGATNLVTGLADALFDSIPLVVITGQVPSHMMGLGALQETPIIEVTRTITKHNYLVLNVEDIPRVMEEAFFLATSGRPGPALIDLPMDIQKQLVIPDWEQPMELTDYLSRMPKPPESSQLETIVRLISESRKPVLYVGGGCMSSSNELVKFVELTRIPVASTLMGLGAYPCNDDLSLGMLGMHGTVCANYVTFLHLSLGML